MAVSHIAEETAANTGRGANFFVPLFLFVLVITELSFFQDASGTLSLNFRGRDDYFFVLGYIDGFSTYSYQVLLGLAVIFFINFNEHQALILEPYRYRNIYFVAHLIAITCFYLVHTKLSNTGMGLPIKDLALLSSYLFIALFLCTATTFYMLAPTRFWVNFVRKQKWSILLVLIGIALDGIISKRVLGIQGDISSLLFPPTALLASHLINFLGYKAVVDTATSGIGSGNFNVMIAYACLGYQGIMLVILLLSSYIYFFRKHLIFPNVLLVIPFAVTAIFLLNSVRIALLVIIGATWSPEIAIQGFHSAAGWMNLMAVCLLTIIGINRFSWFTNRPATQIFHLTDENILLVPQLVLLAVSLATLLFTASFDWLYPIRVVLVGAVLFHFRKSFRLGKVSVNLFATGIGIVVFLMWIMVVPDLADKSSTFAATLFAVPAIEVFMWIVFRIIGAVIIVPFAEELAFRGFLLPYLETTLTAFSSPRRQVAATLISSAAFGALHGSWIAGTLAGIGFALARYNRGQLFDAISAHMIANGLLAAFVIIGGNWSYW